MKNRANGQSMVEMALILPILILLLLGIFEGGHIIQSYISLQNASRQAARYAVSGQPLTEGSRSEQSPWAVPDPVRVEAIKNVAIEASVGTGYTQVFSDTTPYSNCETGNDAACAGVLAIQVEGQNTSEQAQLGQYDPDSAGIQGLNVKIKMYHNVAIWDPIYAAIAPGGFVRVRAETIMRNEGVDVTLGGLPPVLDDSQQAGDIGDFGPTSNNPFIDVLEGTTLSPGNAVNVRLRFHEAGTYDIYFNNTFIFSIIVDSTLTGSMPWTVPQIAAASYEIRSEQNGTVIASNSITIEPGNSGDIIVNTNKSPIWPRGSLLEYSLFNHDPTHNPVTIEIIQPNTTANDSVTVDTDGNSAIRTFPTDWQLSDLGDYTFRSIQNSQAVATRTIALVQGCIKVNQGSCTETTTPSFAQLTPIFIHVENHAFSHDYSIVWEDTLGARTTIANITTDGSGKRFGTLWTIPLTPPAQEGIHKIITYDNGRKIAEKEIGVGTPAGPFIIIQGGYEWPAGSHILYQLRQHEPNIRYDTYWEEFNPAGVTTQILTNTTLPTDVSGDVWLDYTIPDDTPTGEFHLHSRLGAVEGGTPTTPYSGTTLHPIQVTGKPFLRIKEGNPQVPGAEITVELGNHPKNTDYDVYIIVNGTGVKMPESPVSVGSDGSGSLNYVIPTTLANGQSYLLQSYVKGTTTNMVAETTLDLVAPDIRVTKIDLPATPIFNTPFPITVTIENRSNVTITHQSFDVDVYIDPILAPDLDVALPPGEIKLWIQPPFAMQSTQTLTTMVTLYGAQNHEIWARADTSGRIVEVNEQNNLLNAPIIPNTCQIEFDGGIFSSSNTQRFGDTTQGSLSRSGSGINTTVTLDNNGSSGMDFDDANAGYYFAYHQISDDFDVWVRTDTQSGGASLSDDAYYGLEIRASLNTDADKLQWVRSKGVKLGYRQRQLSNNPQFAGEFDLGPAALPTEPVWLRIVKVGSSFTLYYSTDTSNPPTDWTEVQTVIAPGLANNVYLGLMNTPLSNAQNTVSFTGYHVCGNAAGVCGPVREGSGRIVINANNYINNVAGSGYQWQETFRNGRVSMSVPNNGNAWTGSSYVTAAPRMEYEVDVTNAGRYYIWLLGYSPGSGSNSVHVGLPQPNHPNSAQYFNQSTASSLAWFNTVQSGGSDYVDLTAGSHTLSIWAHRDGFELYQILLIRDDDTFDPNSLPDPLAVSQSQCSVIGVPPAPAGLARCVSAIENGDFEDVAQMSLWHRDPGGTSRTSIPHYIGPSQSFSILMADTFLQGRARSPWLYQEFIMPDWVITPTLNGGTTLDLKLHVGVNPEGATNGDDLRVKLRDQSGAFDLTAPLTITTDTDQVPLVPPVTNNNAWILNQVDVAQGLANPADMLNLRGQTLQLYLEAPNAGSDSTTFYLDNVVFDICSVEPEPPLPHITKVAGEIRVLINGIPEKKEGIFVWIYAIDGEMQKTYTIQDSTFSFFNLPADSNGTTYIMYAEYEENGRFYSASNILSLKPGDQITDIAMLLF